MNRKGTRGTSQPPAISSFNPNRYRLRFGAIGGGAVYTIGVNDLYDCVCMAVSTTAARRLFSAIRVRKVELWGAPVSSSTPTGNSVSIRDLSITPNGGSQALVSDTHLGADRPSHVVWRPRQGSMASEWLPSTSTAALLNVLCSQGSILDIEFDAVIGAQPSLVNSAVGAAITSVLGEIYVRALDSNNGANFAANPAMYNSA